MQKKLRIGVFIAIALILVVGGYFLFFQKGPSEESSGSIFSSKTYSGDVSALVLDLSDLPEGYKVISKGPRVKSDVSDKGIELGWIEGYQISFAGGDGTIFDATAISQSISRYPIENISLILGVKEEGYTQEMLPNPNIGDNSIASKITDDSTGIGLYRIEFVKKDIYMNFNTLGDFELLTALAKKAANKI